MTVKKHMRLRIALVFLLVPTISGVAREIRFGRDVFPILQRSCLECHGSQDQKGGLRLDRKADLMKSEVVTAGDATESELFRRINLPKEHDDVMPNRGDLLKGREIEIVRQWINAGAVWPDSFEAPKHWAYVKPPQVALPKLKNAKWVRNAIDNFIGAKQEAAGLNPSPEASKRALIRRLSLDLIGLPPSTVEIDAFLKDESGTAYERLVDRLLKSEEFGVRWAQPWLDYARYADSHGFQRDNFREIWAYRDWVVNAINQDMPYDQFSIEQLAGDLIPNATEAQKIATGFNQCTPINVEAGSEPEESRVNQVFDRVNTLGAVWLGTTFECSQCHDHKYDPFTQKDYYGMFAFFNTTRQEADRTNPKSPGSIQFKGIYLDLADPDVAAAKVKLDEKSAALKQEIKKRNRELTKGNATWEQSLLATSEEVARLRPLKIHEVKSSAGSTFEFLENKSVLFTGTVPNKDNYELTVETDIKDITGLRIEFLAHDSLSAKGPGRGNGKRPNVVLNDFKITAASVSGKEKADLTVVDITADFSQSNWPVKQLLDDDPKTGWAISPKFGVTHWFNPIFDQPVSFDGGTRFTVKLIQQYGGGRNAGCVRISAMTGDPKAGNISEDIIKIVKTPAAKRNKKQVAALRKYRAESDSILKKLNAESAATTKKLKALEAPKTLVMQEMAKPRDSFMFKRGVYTAKGEPMKPLVPAVLHPLQDKHFQHNGQKITEPNRLVMAKWLMDSDNPITARTAVNRFWQEIFGRGIVTTPEDFGIKGEPPTHPGLIDWLANHFIENDWSMKETLKTIVMSATYRQSSKVTPQLTKLDPQNALYARGPRFRMTAEMIRDNALAIAGLLSTNKGGPPIKPFQPDGVWSKVGGTSYKYEVSPGEKKYRRGVYVVIKRGAPYPSFVNFDANERMTCRVERNRSNTPLQALTLMNDPAYVEAAMAFAKRMISEKPADSLVERIDHAFQLATSRQPRQRETLALQSLFQSQLAAGQKDAKSAKEFIGKFRKPADMNDVEFVAWYAVAAALLNLDETITKG
ncbi:MAG: PSD1 and planctomycete cytochrome C domain-containing protein [Limisphaerales bacterium]